MTNPLEFNDPDYKGCNPRDAQTAQEQIKPLVDRLRAAASRGPVTTREIFTMTDSIMDIISRSDQPARVVDEGFAHELWAMAQLAPHEGIEDGVSRILAALLPTEAGAEPVAGRWIVDNAEEFERFRQNFTTTLLIEGPNMTLPEMSERLCWMREEIKRLSSTPPAETTDTTALVEAKEHLDAICIGLASPVDGEDPYGWLDRAKAAQKALADALGGRT